MLEVLTSGSVTSQNSEWDDVFGITVLWLKHLSCILTGGHSAHLCNVCSTFGFAILFIIFHFVTQRDGVFSSADSFPAHHMNATLPELEKPIFKKFCDARISVMTLSIGSIMCVTLVTGKFCAQTLTMSSLQQVSIRCHLMTGFGPVTQFL